MKRQILKHLRITSARIATARPRNGLKRRRGFTLIELLVLIAMIGILASLLPPALSRAKATAESAICKSNLWQHALALNVYLRDSDGKYSQRYYPFQSSAADVHFCPTAKRLITRSPIYGYQYYYEGTGGSDSTPEGSVEKPLPESGVRMPSDIIAFTHFAQFGSGCFGIPPVGFGWPGVPEIPSPRVPLHRGGENVAFCDGHMESENSDSIPQWSTDGGRRYFKPDAAHARRWNHDNQPHPETWQNY